MVLHCSGSTSARVLSEDVTYQKACDIRLNAAEVIASIGADRMPVVARALFARRLTEESRQTVFTMTLHSESERGSELLAILSDKSRDALDMSLSNGQPGV